MRGVEELAALFKRQTKNSGRKGVLRERERARKQDKRKGKKAHSSTRTLSHHAP